jgi:hypothetical protein
MSRTCCGGGNTGIRSWNVDELRCFYSDCSMTKQIVAPRTAHIVRWYGDFEAQKNDGCRSKIRCSDYLRHFIITLIQWGPREGLKWAEAAEPDLVEGPRYYVVVVCCMRVEHHITITNEECLAQ